jgi:hypothetical protein
VFKVLSNTFFERRVEQKGSTSAMGWASRRRQEQGSNARDHHVRRNSRRPKEHSRLSERLVDLIAPYREDGFTPERYELLISAAAMGWNLSLLSETERPEALRKCFRRAKVRDVEGVAQVIISLMRRKEQLFPDDDRPIVSWEVSESDGQWHVTVASLAD